MFPSESVSVTSRSEQGELPATVVSAKRTVPVPFDDGLYSWYQY
jgi:hypothetical protein